MELGKTQPGDLSPESEDGSPHRRVWRSGRRWVAVGLCDMTHLDCLGAARAAVFMGLCTHRHRGWCRVLNTGALHSVPAAPGQLLLSPDRSAR